MYVYGWINGWIENIPSNSKFKKPQIWHMIRNNNYVTPLFAKKNYKFYHRTVHTFLWFYSNTEKKVIVTVIARLVQVSLEYANIWRSDPPPCFWETLVITHMTLW